ncbi:hypothetical protein Ac2012v2_000181 [Leucoagaricus gongylophorus]
MMADVAPKPCFFQPGKQINPSLCLQRKMRATRRTSRMHVSVQDTAAGCVWPSREETKS